MSDRGNALALRGRLPSRARPFSSFFFALALTVAFALLAEPLAAQSKAADTGATDTRAMPFGGVAVSGDWVVYRDRTWPAPTWVGFLQYDDETWGAFLKTPSTSADVRILFRGAEAEGSLVLTGQRIISSITPADVEAVNYLMGLLPELWKLSVEAARLRDGRAADKSASPAARVSGPSRSTLLPPLLAQKANLADFGGDVTLSWAAEIPVFALLNVAGSGKEPALSVERAGRATEADPEAFFGFEPVPETALAAKAKGANEARVKAGPREKRTVDGLELTLDGNWTMYADNTFFMGNDAVLIVISADRETLGLDAAIGRAELPPVLFRLFTNSSGNAWEVPGNRAITGSPARFRVDNLFYDRETGAINRDIKLCLPSYDAKGSPVSVRIVSLSVRDELYRANTAYFEGILPK